MPKPSGDTVPCVDCQGMDRNPKPMSALISILETFEGIAYLTIAFALGVPVVMLVFSAVMRMLAVFEGGVFETALAVLDSLLLAFIFVELIDTIRIAVTTSESRIFLAEPFLLVGLIAVVRSILLLTANLHQGLSMEQSQILLIEVGILAFLVIILTSALYFARRMRRSEKKREISE